MNPRREATRRSPRAALALGAVVLIVVAIAVAVRESSSHAPSSTPSAHGGPGFLAPVPTTAHVTAGAPLTYGEAVGATSGSLAVVAATAWLPTMAVVQTWQRTSGQPWSAPRALLPTGFHRGYDPSIATLSDGTIVVVSGVDLDLRPYCLDAGSVALERVSAHGTGTPVLVDDQRTSSGFDDRPTVTAGSGTEVWAGWSRGTQRASCDLIGADDQAHVALSGDGGRSFGPSMSIPEPGANFGVQIAPTGSRSAYVAWTQTLPTGMFRILLAHVTNMHLDGPPIVVGTGTPLPSRLPGASFPSFTIPTLMLMNGRPALAWAAWVADRAVLTLAVPSPSGSGWLHTTVAPTPGADDLLPALGGSTHEVVLLSAVHRRSTDAVSYQLRRVAIGTGSRAIVVGPARTIVGGLPGPGYREVGESLEITSASGVSTSALVAGSARISRIWSATWTP